MVSWILENVTYPRSGRWIEPFMGSGVVGFNAMPEKAEFSDINPHIINFYNAIKNCEITEKTARAYLEAEGARLREIGEEHYYHIRERFNREKSPLDFLFLSRAGFNGVIRFNGKGEFNIPFCKKPLRFSKAYITKIVHQIRSVYELIGSRSWIFSCLDFRPVISSATDLDFIYCDPPYYGRHTDYFNSWSDEDESDLFECLSNTKAKFILSTWYGNEYRKNPSIDKYWRDFYVLKKEHFYHVGAKEINRRPMVEALVMNYVPAELTLPPKARQLVLMDKKSKYSTR
jgi:DNA adenine methylase